MLYFWRKGDKLGFKNYDLGFMKKLIQIIVCVFIANSFWSCEKDDICESGTPNTPRMIIEFYDNNVVVNKKNVVDLALVAETTTDTINFNGVSKVEVPLKTIDDITKYDFIFDSNNTILSLRNTDKITINYTRKDEYISRACGFKTLFTLNSSNGIIKTIDSNNWIKNIQIQQVNINNENEIHVKIFI
jgi:Family of unknown function (DUF6452)